MAAARLADTRPGATTTDGLFQGDGSRVADSEYTIQIAGRGAVPVDAVGAVVNVAAVDTVTCAFTNTARGAIAVEGRSTWCPLSPEPLPHPTRIEFVGDVSGVTWTYDPPLVVADLVPGTYTSTQLGCSIVSIRCDDTNSTGSGRTATFNVEPGETVTCTFTSDCCPPPYIPPPCPPFCRLMSPATCTDPPAPAG